MLRQAERRPNIFIDQLLLGIAILLVIAIFASKASGRLGLPSLLLFLAVGMLAGSEGIGGIEFADVGMAQTLGVVALAFILFSGGLDTSWPSVRPVLWPALSLSTVAVLLTAVSMGLFATWLFGLRFIDGLLLGAIVSSTDAAAVFSVMRSRGIGLRDHLRRLLELESGSNDPMAIFLTTGVIGLIVQPSSSILGLVPMFVVQMVLGAAIGLGVGWAMVWVINRINLTADGLYSVLTLAIVLLVYGLAAVTGGNGFLAVYLAGMMMGNQDFIHKRSIRRFHDGLGWLMQIAMFITLGLLVFPSQLRPVIWTGLALALFLILVARPLGVFLALLPFPMPKREKAMISWVGLRGAVPIILATYPLVSEVPNADVIFHVIFFVVIVSVLLQGPLIPVVARWLNADEPLAQASPRYPLEFEQTADLDSDLVEVPVPGGSPAVGRSIVDLHLPEPALVVLISRDDKFIVPRGSTVILEGDRLLVLADEESLAGVRRTLDIAG
ncbi:MAG TPA: potassium/proton antiporter [Trueperaceae bacterium]